MKYDERVDDLCYELINELPNYLKWIKEIDDAIHLAFETYTYTVSKSIENNSPKLHIVKDSKEVIVRIDNDNVIATYSKGTNAEIQPLYCEFLYEATADTLVYIIKRLFETKEF